MVENVACAAAVTVWCIDACMICGLWVGGFDQHRWGEEDARGGGAGRECGGGCKRKLTCVLNDEEVDVNAWGRLQETCIISGAVSGASHGKVKSKI
jgi:hypothetical protein